MSDIGIMDYFLTKNEIKVDPDMDIPINYENSELMSSDFFDSILNLEKTNLDELDAGLFNNIEMDMNVTSDESVTYDDMQCETSTFSDSGLSSDLQEMPDQILSDEELLKSIFDAAPSAITEKPQQPVISDATKPVEYVRPFIAPTVTEPEEKQKIINIIKPKQVIRVQPLNGNSRSVLLPINIKDLKTIKIINTNNLKAENIKFTSTVRQNKKSGNEKFIIKPSVKNGSIEELNNSAGIQRRHKPSISSSNTNDDVLSASEEDTTPPPQGGQYPLLLLTAEEKRLLSKDGIQLPCRYPLTKHEERELKRIRRKIRNKISAQDSRKRKKEYVDGLEERVKQCSEENRSLVKRIKLLQLQNNKLSTQLSKLQALVFKSGTSRAHPATCLMIVLLSVMLVTLPNLRNSSTGNSAVDKQLNSLQQYVARRALLFSQQATNEDTVSLNMDEFITFPAKKKIDDDDDDGIVDLVNGSTAYNSNNNNNKKESSKLNLIDENNIQSLQMPVKYDRHVGGSAVDVDRGGGGGTDGSYSSHGIKRYIEPDIDDHWPPAKKRNVSSVTATGHINRTEFYE